MKIHFIGIGGIGLSGLAHLYLEKGHEVQGSDQTESEILNGFNVFLGHKKENITSDIDLVIFSEAVSEDNVELKRAKELNIPCLSGAQALAKLSKEYFCICVSGMHGKTTTSCMLAKILTDCGFDPTYIIGTKNGWRKGNSKYLVIEADDYKAKLLNYEPDVLILTNIEEEHMDFFKSLNHILKVFKQYVSQVKEVIIANEDDENIKKVLKGVEKKIEYYSKGKIQLSVPGEHNKYNAQAALKTALYLGIEKEKALKSLKQYKGTWRRFQEKEINGILVISDYAHHPTEIRATLKAVKEKYPKKKLWCFFQPHQKQRTFYLFNNFVKSFRENMPDELFITDIYEVKGRERRDIKVSASGLAQEIGAKYLKQDKIADFIKKNVKKGEIALIMGAGSIYEIIHSL